MKELSGLRDGLGKEVSGRMEQKRSDASNALALLARKEGAAIDSAVRAGRILGEIFERLLLKRNKKSFLESAVPPEGRQLTN